MKNTKLMELMTKLITKTTLYWQIYTLNNAKITSCFSSRYFLVAGPNFVMRMYMANQKEMNSVKPCSITHSSLEKRYVKTPAPNIYGPGKIHTLYFQLE